MIKICLDNSLKKNLERKHWSWFWVRLCKKKIKTKEYGELSLKDFFLKVLGTSRTELRDVILADYAYLYDLCSFKNNFNFRFRSKKKQKFNVWVKRKNKKTKKYYYKYEKQSFNLICKEHWGFSDFSKGISNLSSVLNSWNAYELCSLLGITVCPYCNREYVFTLRQGNGRPDIDHFFPESEYPYLSCSLYNFIPSCKHCNSQKSASYNVARKKGMTEIVYPYKEGFEESINGQKKNYAKFMAFIGKNDSSIYDSVRCYLKFNCNGNPTLAKKISNSIKAFKLRELYDCHQIELKDLLMRYRNYSERKLSEIIDMVKMPKINGNFEVLRNQLRGKMSNSQIDTLIENCVKELADSYIQNSKNEILGLPLGSKDKEYPLRKFKQDIIDQLDEEKKMGNI